MSRCMLCQGQCIKNVCVCYSGFEGDACSKPVEMDCNGHGVSSLGKCECFGSWTGVNCETMGGDALKIVADVEFAWEVNVSVWQDLVEKTVLSSPRRVRIRPHYQAYGYLCGGSVLL